MKDLLQFLSAGGDVATMALLYIMWRFDRRLLTLEVKLARCGGCQDEGVTDRRALVS